MKKRLRKILSVMLAAVMIFSVSAIGVSAETTTATNGYYTYTVDENGNATITDVDTSISGDVTIPSTLDGYPVTCISGWAFNGCDNITDISIPDTVIDIGSSLLSGTDYYENTDNWENGVLYIGDCLIKMNSDYTGDYVIKDGTRLIASYAFYYCANMESVQIPSSVKYICDGAFDHCFGLSSIVIPEGVINIGYLAFSCCNLTSIEISDTVTSIGIDAFDLCLDLTSISVDENNKYYSSNSEGILFNKDKTELIRYPAGKTETSYEIPDGVKVLARSAFSGSDHLEHIKISDSVTTIGYRAFYSCDGFENIIIPDSVKNIEGCAFESCNSLRSISIPESVNSIEYYAFENCYQLSKVEIPDTKIRIDYRAFEGTAYYKNSNNWKNGVLYIGNHLIAADETISGSYEIKDDTITISYMAFRNCQELTEIIIPDSVKVIGAYAFDNTGYYNNIDNWETGVLYIGNHLITASEEISGKYNVIPGTLTVADFAFTFCDSLNAVIVSESVSDIGRYAFGGDSMEYIHIPASVTTIGDSIFGTSGNGYICSDSGDCYAKSYAEMNGIDFKFCGKNNTENPDVSVEPETSTDINRPEGPIFDLDVVVTPSITKIGYGDSIILHADTSKIPEGGYVEWSADNDNFSYTVADDGTCTITPESSGDTTFTATIYDAEGDAVSTDSQTMTSKAGFFQKLIAFFKKLFGLTKVYSNFTMR